MLHGDLRRDISDLEGKLGEMETFVKEHDHLLRVSNGTPSIVERLRTLETNLNSFMEEMRTERAERKRREEEWRSRWFWTFVTIGLPLTLSAVGYVALHVLGVVK
jgi:hypothetical protein